MYVLVAHYFTREKEEQTFLEMITLELKMNAQQSGLSHYHILRDKKKRNKFCIIEFWYHKNDRDSYDKLDSHLYFLSLLEGVIEGLPETQECDLIK